jgi:Ca2+-binding EF-hand superfamily protein
MNRLSSIVVQKEFKKLDRNGASAIHKNDVVKVLKSTLVEYNADIEKVELEDLLKQHVKGKPIVFLYP